jgi:hypothetical protein
MYSGKEGLSAEVREVKGDIGFFKDLCDSQISQSASVQCRTNTDFFDVLNDYMTVAPILVEDCVA